MRYFPLRSENVILADESLRLVVENQDEIGSTLILMTTELAQKAGFFNAFGHPRECGGPEYGFVSITWIPVSTGMTLL